MRVCVCAVLMVLIPTLAKSQPYPGPLNFPISDVPVTVNARTIRVGFPLRASKQGSEVPPTAGYWAWRFSTGGEEPVSVVLMSNTILRTGRVSDVVKASSLRLCPTAQTSSLSCERRIRGRIELSDTTLFIVVEEPEIVARVNRTRPSYLWRQVIQPEGRVAVTRLCVVFPDDTECKPAFGR